MKKSNLLIGIIIGLLACNGLLLYFVMRPTPRNNREAPKIFIIEKLHFNQEQIDAYELLIQNHRKQVKETERGIRESKNALYQTLNNNNPAVQSDSLILAMNAYQQKMEKIHFEHFMAIKNLCTPEQLPAFEELSKELARLFGPKHPPRKHQ